MAGHSLTYNTTLTTCVPAPRGDLKQHDISLSSMLINLQHHRLTTTWCFSAASMFAGAWNRLMVNNHVFSHFACSHCVLHSGHFEELSFYFFLLDGRVRT